MKRKNYKQVHLRLEDWQAIKDLGVELERDLTIPKPSVPNVIMFCVSNYKKVNDAKKS